jgi:hypothetical protein
MGVTDSELKQELNMIGAIIVTVAVLTIVAAYMITVNRFLRADEHYNDGVPARTLQVVRTTAPREARSSAACAAGIPART